jgi:5-hydroxyisourate hydrolase
VIVFHVGEYFKGEPRVADPPFLDRVPIWFGIADPQVHYHVRLLAPP